MSAAHAYFEAYKDARGEWRWRMRARNGRIVADGAEGYASKRNVLRAITTMQDTMACAACGNNTVQVLR